MNSNQKTWVYKKKCRICNSNNLVKYFDFGAMPIVDSFIGAGEKGDIRIPLEVMYCDDCSNSQLSVIVNPTYLFSNYLYHSSVSKPFREHCRSMAKDIKLLFNNKEGLKCLDIASNDGCLLKEFQTEKYKVIGVEPADNLCKIAEDNGIRTICDFWGKDAAKKIIEDIGKVDVITATNVFAHVDDLHSFLDAIYEALSDNGVFVIEFPYLRNLVKYTEFDTIYHEHLSYFLVKPLTKLLPPHKMHIADLSESEIHGGSIRVSVIKDSNNKIKTNTDILKKYLNNEIKEGLHTINPYIQLQKKANIIKKEIVENVKEFKEKRKKVAAYCASAKGNTFINYCGFDKDDIKFIVDDTEAKQGLLYAGTRIPVVAYDWIANERPDYLLILAWNFADEIIKKTKDFKDYGGKYIIAIPKLKII